MMSSGMSAFVAVDVLGDRPQLLVGEAAERVLHHLEVLVEVARTLHVGELGEERPDRDARRRSRAPARASPDRCPRRPPARRAWPASSAIASATNAHVMRASIVAFGAVVEQRACRLDRGGGVGHVVGEDLVVVDRSGAGECGDAVAHDLLREVDRGRGGREIGGCHGRERYAYVLRVTSLLGPPAPSAPGSLALAPVTR